MESEKIKPKQILLADDQEEVREAIKLLLSLDGHVVAEARNGQEALGMFAPGRFDLVITDYAMPVMKGDELARNIKRLAPGQDLLMITGSAEKLGGIAPAVDRLLHKPFSLESLRRAVAGLPAKSEFCA